MLSPAISLVGVGVGVGGWEAVRRVGAPLLPQPPRVKLPPLGLKLWMAAVAAVAVKKVPATLLLVVGVVVEGGEEVYLPDCF